MGKNKMEAKRIQVAEDVDLIIALKQDIRDKFGIPVDNIHLVGYPDGTVEIEAGDGDIYGFDEAGVNSFIEGWVNETTSNL